MHLTELLAQTYIVRGGRLLYMPPLPLFLAPFRLSLRFFLWAPPQPPTRASFPAPLALLLTRCAIIVSTTAPPEPGACTRVQQLLAESL